jgi:ABC-2 type transport system permease protein
MGAAAGGLGPLVRDALEGNASLMDLIGRLVPGGSADLVELLITAQLAIAGVLAAAAGIEAVLRLRAEEAEGRAEMLLAVPASRARWLLGTLAIAGLSVAAVTATAGAAAATSLALSGAAGTPPTLIVASGLAHIPAAAVFPAVAALAFAIAPRLSSAIAWAFLTVALILGQFGDLFGLPAWLQDLSPFRHASAMPVLPGALAMAVAAVAPTAMAAYLIRHRDLTP